jgi:hypothetical protein
MKNRKILSTIGILIVALTPAAILDFLNIHNATVSMICVLIAAMAAIGIVSVWNTK